MSTPRNHLQLLWCVVVVSACVMLSACGGRAMTSAEVPSAATAWETGEYLIGPGDTLDVFVWRQPELSVTVPVRPDGRISTPLAEELVAVGKTPAQLAREIEQALSEYVRVPEVNVIVQGFVGTFGAQIRILGEVANPGSVPYRERMTLLDAAIEAGGLTDFAAGNRARLVRTVDGESREMRVRLEDLLEGELDENLLLRPGDIVVVPEAIF